MTLDEWFRLVSGLGLLALGYLGGYTAVVLSNQRKAEAWVRDTAFDISWRTAQTMTNCFSVRHHDDGPRADRDSIRDSIVEGVERELRRKY